MALVVNLREDRSRIYDRRDANRCTHLKGSVIMGAQSEFFVIDTDEQELVAGVQFRPGGGFPFLKPPAGELYGMHVSLEDVWGGAASELRERLLEAPTHEARLTVLEEALLARVARPLERHRAVAHALAEFDRGPNGRTVADVTDEVGLSRRRFIEVFRGEVGLTPKLFCRVRRFQEVLRRVRSGREVDWTDVALGCGYFDQAHFIHDFRGFSGLSPTDYSEQCTPHTNHVPMPD